MVEGQLRLKILRNIPDPDESQAKEVFISRQGTIQELREICSNALDLNVRKIYDASGHEIKQVNILKERAILFVSEGEAFVVENNGRFSVSTSSVNMKIAIMGAAAVGKSALALRFVYGEYRTYYDPTISDTFEKLITRNDKRISMSILDTAGMEDYSALEDDWINGRNAIILTCSVDIFSSLEHLRTLHQKILHKYNMDTYDMPILVLCCNKSDLQGVLTGEQVRKMGEELGIAVFETSAAQDKGVNQMFEFIVDQFLKKIIVNSAYEEQNKCSCNIF